MGREQLPAGLPLGRRSATTSTKDKSRLDCRTLIVLLLPPSIIDIQSGEQPLVDGEPIREPPCPPGNSQPKSRKINQVWDLTRLEDRL